MSALVLVVDAARTGVRAAAVTRDGAVASSARVEVPVSPGVHGWDEQATDELWRATLGAVRGVLDDVDADRLDRVAVTADPRATVLWDRETLGSPRRAVLAAPVEVLPWVAAHEPRTWALVEEGGYAVGGLESYLVARTTLGTWHVTDPTHAAAGGLLDPDGGRWSTPACRAAGVPVEALPELVPSAGHLATTEARALHGLALPVTALLAHDPRATPDERLVLAAAAAHA